jgi:hypothetical protein
MGLALIKLIYDIYYGQSTITIRYNNYHYLLDKTHGASHHFSFDKGYLSITYINEYVEKIKIKSEVPIVVEIKDEAIIISKDIASKNLTTRKIVPWTNLRDIHIMI